MDGPTAIESAQPTSLGEAIPDTAHAVSVSLPSWKANVGYEEGESWVLDRMTNGYPRFFIHLSIKALADDLVAKYGRAGEKAFLFPSTAIANRCLDFVTTHSVGHDDSDETGQTETIAGARVIDFTLRETSKPDVEPRVRKTVLSATVIPDRLFPVAKQFWQHTGDGVSSRRAQFFHDALREGYLVPHSASEHALNQSRPLLKGPRRYRREDVDDSGKQISSENPSDINTRDSIDYLQFVEERFGRNLGMSLSTNAKVAIRRRIAGSLTADVALEDALNISNNTSSVRKGQELSIDDVYLWPTGMSAIFNTHRTLLRARSPKRSIMFGFPYIDTLKILEKFGPGALFYGFGSAEDLDDLEARCKKGERFLSLFCEFPGNPLLKTPDLERIRDLADRYDFAVVVDETIGNFLNVNVLPLADVVVSSLTKVFSGDSNVMGGSSILNSKGKYYHDIRRSLSEDYEDHYWPEDAIFMERNSRDFVLRNKRINRNAEALCQVLKTSPYIKEIFYPQYSSSKQFFDARKNDDGGYGGLFSITFHSMLEAVAFFDALETAKGPSLGTNFTLSSPFVILAHYTELDWAAKYGAEASLVRVSVGLEEMTDLCAKFSHALLAIEKSRGTSQ